MPKKAEMHQNFWDLVNEADRPSTDKAALWDLRANLVAAKASFKAVQNFEACAEMRKAEIQVRDRLRSLGEIVPN